MKNLLLVFGIVVIFSSCGGNSIEEDAKKLGMLTCEISTMSQEITKLTIEGDMDKVADIQKELTKLSIKNLALIEKLEEKYDGEKEKEFEAAFLLVIADCATDN